MKEYLLGLCIGAAITLFILFCLTKMSSTVCPKCGDDVLTSSNYCSHCGSKLRITDLEE